MSRWLIRSDKQKQTDMPTHVCSNCESIPQQSNLPLTRPNGVCDMKEYAVWRDTYEMSSFLMLSVFVSFHYTHHLQQKLHGTLLRAVQTQIHAHTVHRCIHSIVHLYVSLFCGNSVTHTFITFGKVNKPVLLLANSISAIQHAVIKVT